jgi:hypothetical protein
LVGADSGNRFDSEVHTEQVIHITTGTVLKHCESCRGVKCRSEAISSIEKGLPLAGPLQQTHSMVEPLP